MLKNLQFLLLALFFLFTITGNTQSSAENNKKYFLVTEVYLGTPIYSKFNSIGPLKPIDFGFNIGVDRKLKTNAGLGLHLFVNSTSGLGIRGRISQYNNDRKIIDVGIGFGLSDPKFSSSDLEVNVYLNKHLAVYARIDRSIINNYDARANNIPTGIKNKQINLGIRINAPKNIRTIIGAGALVLASGFLL